MSKHLIVVDTVHTVTVDARVVDAVVLVDLAIFAVSTRQTFAGVASHSVNAATTILARVGRSGAFIDRSVTKIACVARMTPALVSIDTVAVDARVELIALNIFASVSTETDSAVTNEGIVAVAATSASVQAGVIIATIINYFFAALSCKAYGAGASKTVDKVSTDPSVATRIRAAFINVGLAIPSSET